MNNSVPMPDYAWMLKRDLIDNETIGGVRGALLATSDGLVRFYYGFEEDDAQTLAALASPLLAVAKSIGDRYTGTPYVRQVMAELQGMIFYACVAGENGVLAVLADTSVNAGQLAYKMVELARKGAEQLSTPTRALWGADSDE